MSDRGFVFRKSVLIPILFFTVLLFSSSFVYSQEISPPLPSANPDRVLTGVHFTSSEEGWDVGGDDSDSAKICATPKSIKFGNVIPGSISSKIGTIQNKGQSDLILSSITIEGASDFSQTNSCTTLPEGDSCVIMVTFAPLSTGKKTAIMSISSNDPTKPTLNVKLSGNVKSSAPPPSPPPSGEFKYQGTLLGTWFLTGVCSFPEGYTSSISESGQFSITIDVYGNITSTGFYGGWPVFGTVDLEGDYSWTVAVNAPGTTVSLSGQGHVTLSGNSLSLTGSWGGTVTSTAATCTFTGGWSLTGTTSY